MRKTPLVLAVVVTTVAAAVMSAAQPRAAEDERSQFRFEFAETGSYRGLGVEGWVYNDLRWRVTNVRLRVDCVDANTAVSASGAGWVIGDVPAGGRGYFYVPIPSRAAAYRVSVQSFDKVSLERDTQAP